MAVWPASLPSSLLANGYSRQKGDQTIRTQMDAGPAKVRRRFSAAPTEVSGSMIVTMAQIGTLQDFFDQTLAGGSLPFDWADPVDGAVVSWRFTAPPSSAALGASLFRVSLSLEILP